MRSVKGAERRKMVLEGNGLVTTVQATEKTCEELTRSVAGPKPCGRKPFLEVEADWPQRSFSYSARVAGIDRRPIHSQGLNVRQQKKKKSAC
jgi:hypothetical protein